MKYIHNEYLFQSYDEALSYQDNLILNGIVLYTCAKCAIHFGSDDPYTADHGIVCRICMKTMNLNELDNYRPDDEGYDEMEY